MASLVSLSHSLWSQRQLTWALIVRDIGGRYRGSMFGWFWAGLTPLLMLGVYTFVFSVVFKARWGVAAAGVEESRVMFALILSIGLIVFNLFAECINKSASIIRDNANYVKKVVFPLEILPVVTLGTALFHMLVSLGVWLCIYMAFLGLPPVTALLLPLLLLPLLLLVLGLSWFLAATGVYLRDVAHFTVIATTIIMFLTPIFYPLTAIPESYRAIIRSNPLADIIEQMREVMIFGHLPDWQHFGTVFVVSLLIAWGGYNWFQKTRSGFADVV